MKQNPQNYTRALIKALRHGEPVGVLARQLWYLLQKSHQYRDLPQILDGLELEYGRQSKHIIAHIATSQPLESKTKTLVRQHLATKFAYPVILIEDQVPDLVGVVVTVDGREIDLSVNGKIELLRAALKGVNHGGI